MRIVSLLPSATEIVGALGLADRLVGRSEECDWPPEVRALPAVTASRVDTSALAGAEIDAAVRAALAEGRSLYAVDAALLERLQPDLILTQDLCEVCAVSSSEVRSCAAGAEVVSLDAHTIGELCERIEELAARLGVPERGADVVATLRRRLEAVRTRIGDEPRPRVFVAEWLEPPFAGGHWVPEMVAAAGGECVLGRAGEPSYATTWEEVRAAAPDVIIAAPCGYDRLRAAQEAATSVPDLGCPVVAVDANAFFSRCGPRLADGVEQLAAILRPRSGLSATADRARGDGETGRFPRGQAG
jgi:iron complex transport system substrate-binding protein